MKKLGAWKDQQEKGSHFRFLSITHFETSMAIWPVTGMQEMIPKSRNSMFDTYTYKLPFFSTKRISFHFRPFFKMQEYTKKQDRQLPETSMVIAERLSSIPW